VLQVRGLLLAQVSAVTAFRLCDRLVTGHKCGWIAPLKLSQVQLVTLSRNIDNLGCAARSLEYS
jgi:hypothetical protein